MKKKTEWCGDCTSKLGKNDRYCKHYGTARGKGKFYPYRNFTCIVYGPPVKIKKKIHYKCPQCGYKWTTISYVVATYCPKCSEELETTIEWLD